MRLRDIWRRIAFLSRRGRNLEDIEEELRLHQELRARAFEEQGLMADSAAIAAQRQFGNRTYVKESAWDVWSVVPIENAWRDLKFAIRVLRANPGFTILAVLTLALGIGATTAMFRVIDNVLVEPFPYAHQQRLITLLIHGRVLHHPARCGELGSSGQKGRGSGAHSRRQCRGPARTHDGTGLRGRVLCQTPLRS
jgi:hypothetical protein